MGKAFVFGANSNGRLLSSQGNRQGPGASVLGSGFRSPVSGVDFNGLVHGKHGTRLYKGLCLTASLFYFLKLKPELIWESHIDIGKLRVATTPTTLGSRWFHSVLKTNVNSGFDF